MTTEEFLAICAPGATCIEDLDKALMEGAPEGIPEYELGIARGGARAMVWHLLNEFTKSGVIED